MIWFTADTHFRHANIIRYCNRPFGSVEEMDEVLLRNINECVRPDDTLYHLGDFALHGRGVEKIRPKIKCRNVTLILGNHDPHSFDGTPTPALAEHFSKVATMMHVTVEVDKQRHLVVLCHYAMRVWPHSHRGSWHLYGHSHGKLPPVPGTLDVGVDCHDYRPISAHEVAAKRDQPPHYTA